MLDEEGRRLTTLLQRLLALSVVLIFAVAAAGCGGDEEPAAGPAGDEAVADTEADDAVADEEEPLSVKIGLITGASGQYAVVGENYIKGAEVAREVWLEENPDHEIELIVEDDGFNPQRGMAAYQKLTSVDQIDALVNMTSPTIDAIYSVAREANLPIAQGGEQGIPPEDDNVFQLLPGNIATEVALGEHVSEQGHENVAVFYGNSGVYVRFAEAFEEGYGDGGTINKFGIGIEDRDYRSHITKALASNPDAFVFITTPEQGANLVKLLREQGGTGQPYFFDGSIQTGWADYERILGDANLLNGATAVVIRQHIDDEFASRYEEKHGEAPGIAADWAYDSFMLLMRTWAGDREQWIENMRNAAFDGAGGRVEFDEVGVRIPDYAIGEIENGSLPQ
jgi:ABC-type branched-subunit amino acid transport system substrate-binding protein